MDRKTGSGHAPDLDADEDIDDTETAIAAGDGAHVSLAGHLLVAMPGMSDPRFERSVIYMCAHSPTGAMGLVVNRRAESIDYRELLGQLGIPTGDLRAELAVHLGGPVEPQRGFVLHSGDYNADDATMLVTPEVGLTATLDILRTISRGQGPRHALLALGYAGWGPGQLESEMQANGWLHAPADARLLFDHDLDTKWARAIRAIGIDPSFLSAEAGRA